MACVLAFVAWGDSYSWRLGSLTSYQLFPLFGLLAFSLMWSHYLAAALRMYLGMDKSVLAGYFETTSLLVLTLILLHPGLLAFRLWQDGQGLPPTSQLNFVAPAARWAVIVAFIALAVFLLYELRRFYADRSWWKYVQYANDAAMVLIYVHALRLGGALMSGWFLGVWCLYGITFLAAAGYVYSQKRKPAATS